MGSPILQPCSSPPRAALSQTPTPQTCTISAPSPAPNTCQDGDPHKHDLHSTLPHPQACTGLHNLHSTSLCPTACQASDPHTQDLCQPHPQACTGLHDLCSAGPLPWGLPSQWSTISTGLCPHAYTGLHDLHQHEPLKLTKPAMHRHAQSPLHQACAFRNARPMLQRPTSLPQWKASICRPMGPHPPASCHRRAPNLPKRHTQTGLDAKAVTSQQLRLQFYCSRTGVF
jgi:hypothetical protein